MNSGSPLENILGQFYGRKQELAVLGQALFSSQEKTKILFVSGESGAGKTALIKHYFSQKKGKNDFFVSGKFSALSNSQPYSALIEILKIIVKKILSENESEIIKWKRKITLALGENKKIVCDFIPDLERLIGPSVELARLNSDEKQNRFYFTFANFIKCLCSSKHPLYLFLDDIHVADEASLSLLKYLYKDSDLANFYLIACFRSDEIKNNQTACQFVDSLQSREGVHRLNLDLISQEDTRDFLKQSFDLENSKHIFLCDWLFKKTKGNPLLAKEILRLLYKEKSLYYDTDKNRWELHFNGNDLESTSLSIAHVLSHRIKHFSSDDQLVLKVSAVLGFSFEVKALFEFLDSKDRKSFDQSIDHLSEAGFIKKTNTSHYSFTHDQIQHVAYHSFSEAEKKHWHNQIGKTLLNHAQSYEINAIHYHAVDQLNKGYEQNRDTIQKDNLAHLNLRVANHAKESNAYHTAQQHLEFSLKLLAPNPWQKNNRLCLSVYQSLCEVTYLNGCFVDLNNYLNEAFKQTKNLKDKIHFYDIQILSLIMQSKLKESIQLALHVLSELKEPLPQKHLKWHTLYQFFFFYIKTHNKQKKLIDLPLAEDAEKTAVMRILASVSAATYMVDSALLPLVIIHGLNLTLKYGLTPFSIYAFAAYGLLLNGVLGKPKQANRFANLALDLLKKHNEKQTRAKTNLLVYQFIRPSLFRMKESLAPLLKAYEYGLNDGDVEFSFYAAQTYCEILFFTGRKLDYVEQCMKKYIHYFSSKWPQGAQYRLSIGRQLVLNLMSSQKISAHLEGSSFNEKETTEKQLEEEDLNGWYTLYISKMILCYLLEDSGQAFSYSYKLIKQIAKFHEPITNAKVYFYHSLILTARHESYPFVKKLRNLYRIRHCLKKLKKMSVHSPENFFHKYALVLAEMYRLLNLKVKAIKYYELAIQYAQKEDCFNDLALAYELAGKFYQNKINPLIAEVYFSKAYDAYQTWGAYAKAEQLKKATGCSSHNESSLDSYDDQNKSLSIDKPELKFSPEITTSDLNFFRSQLVTVMLDSLALWEFSTNKSKLDLAEESGIWRVHLDGSRVRARALDRYLDLDQLPKKPRWRDVVKTAYYVLNHCDTSENKKVKLESNLQKLLEHLHFKAIANK